MDQTVARIGTLVGAEVVAFLRVNNIQIDLSHVALSASGGASSLFGTFLLICHYIAFLIGERAVLARKIVLAAANENVRHEIRTVSRAISESLQRYLVIKSFISAVTALLSYAVFRWLDLEFAKT